MSVTVARRGSGACCDHQQPGHVAGPTGAENDRSLLQYRSQDQFRMSNPAVLCPLLVRLVLLTKLILRTVLKKAAVIFGSCWPS